VPVPRRLAHSIPSELAGDYNFSNPRIPNRKITSRWCAPHFAWMPYLTHQFEDRHALTRTTLNSCDPVFHQGARVWISSPVSPANLKSTCGTTARRIWNFPSWRCWWWRWWRWWRCNHLCTHFHKRPHRGTHLRATGVDQPPVLFERLLHTLRCGHVQVDVELILTSRRNSSVDTGAGTTQHRRALWLQAVR